MIAFLRGKIADKLEDTVIVDVNGIGYEALVSTQTLVCLPNLGEEVFLHTFMQVKEDGILLIGFASKEEKEMFSMLISVNGVGPKLAVTILSGISTMELKSAISGENEKVISKIKGVGKKTSERIILELKDKVSALGFFSIESSDEVVNINSTEIAIAIDALISLGISRNEAERAIKNCYENGDGAEVLIEKALKGMAR